MVTVEGAALMAGLLILTWASVWDLNTATIHDVHWILFAAAGVVYSWVNGFFIDALPFVGLLAFGGAVMNKLGKWGMGDAALLAGMGFYVYPRAEVFGLTFVGVTFAYLWVHWILRFSRSRFVPVFLLTYITVFTL